MPSAVLCPTWVSWHTHARIHTHNVHTHKDFFFKERKRTKILASYIREWMYVCMYCMYITPQVGKGP